MTPVRTAPRTTGSGIGLRPGDEHYRAYVGPATDYDLVAAMVFNLLTCIGLRQQHRVLDIGCGSLRVGRLLIPYLDAGGYFGVEPNRWLLEDGLLNELGHDVLDVKRPQLSVADSMVEFDRPIGADFAVAQSVFSHCGTDLIGRWLGEISHHLADDGVLVATFVSGTTDFDGSGWIYPACVAYRDETLAALATAAGLHFQTLDWAHPRQRWAAFGKPRYDRERITGPIGWNRYLGRPDRP